MRQELFRKRKDSGSIEHLRKLGKKSLFNLMDLMMMDHPGKEDIQLGEELIGRTPETSMPKEYISGHELMESMISQTAQKTISSSSDFFDDGDEEEARRLEFVLSQLDMDAYHISPPPLDRIGSSTGLGQCGSPHFVCLKLLVLSVIEGFYTSNDPHTEHKEKVIIRTSGGILSSYREVSRFIHDCRRWLIECHMIDFVFFFPNDATLLILFFVDIGMCRGNSRTREPGSTPRSMDGNSRRNWGCDSCAAGRKNR